MSYLQRYQKKLQRGNAIYKKQQFYIILQVKLIENYFLTHCILNRLSHTIYWKSPVSIISTSGYKIYIFLEKNG